MLLLGFVTLYSFQYRVDVKAELGVDRDVVNKIRHRRLSYFGHVVRMDPSRTPNILLHGRVEGTWPRGRPTKRWLDVVREDCNIIGLILPEAVHMATTRRLWSRSIGCWSASTCRLRRSIRSSQLYIYLKLLMDIFHSTKYNLTIYFKIWPS